MPAKGTKWCVNNAVQGSTLPPPARLIMLVLSDMADARTGEIPAKQKPSVTELVRRTGLTESTVKTHRASLERLGWMVIIRPTAAEAARHVPSRYRIAIGSNPTGGRETAPGEGYDTAPETDSRGAGDGPRDGDRGPGDAPAGGQETTTAGGGRRPPSYYYDRNDHNDQEIAADAADAPDPDALFEAPPGEAKPNRTGKAPGKRQSGPSAKSPEEQARSRLAKQLTDTWWQGLEIKPVEKDAFLAARQIVYSLLVAGHPPDAITEAAGRCAYSLTIKGMQFQLKRLAEERERAASNVIPIQRNAYRPYQNPEDQSVYLQGIS